MSVSITHFEIVTTGIAGAITAVIAAVRSIRKSVVKPLVRLIGTVREIAEVVLGKDAVIEHGITVEPRVPGIRERVDRVDDGQLHMIGRLDDLGQRLTVVEHEMTPNSGNSMKDQLNTITQVVTAQPGGTP